ncbi:MAG: hypothetical protein ACXAC2_11685 [Candidatus Kariarchaeaceae archaeon]|jgi:hypothetical protein
MNDSKSPRAKNCDNQEKQNEIYYNEIDYQYFKNHRLIFCFKHYIIRTYGLDTWKALIGRDEFYDMYYNSVSKHGESVLQDLVYLAVDDLDITYQDIMTYFTEYQKKVMKLGFGDFALLG